MWYIDVPSTNEPKAIMSEQKGRGTQLLDKAFNIIDIIAESSSRPKVKDLVELTGYSKPTLYRILSMLVQRGVLQVDGRDQAYQIGGMFGEQKQPIPKHPLLIAASDLHLRNLADSTCETVSLAVMENGQASIIMRHGRFLGEQNEAEKSLGVRPAYCTSIGKCLLAFDTQNDSYKQALQQQSFKPLTESTITEKTELERQLKQILMRGYATEYNEIIDGVSCIAVPIFDHDNQLVAAISVSTPSFRLSKQRELYLFDILTLTARKVASLIYKLSATDWTPNTINNFQHSWPTKVFDPTHIEKGSDGLLFADRYASTVFSIQSKGNLQRIWQGKEQLTGCGELAGHLIISTADRLFNADSDELLYQSNNGHILWSKQSDDGHVWLHTEYNGLFKLIYLNLQNNREFEISLTERIIAITDTPDKSVYCLNNSNQIYKIADKGNILATPQLALTVSEREFGEAVCLTADANNHLWVATENSWELVQFVQKGEHSVTRTVPIPVCTARSVLFEGNEITVIGGRYLGLDRKFVTASQESDVFRLKLD